MTTKQHNYRKDIDGLRAIAVLLVIFNHLGFKFASAGFIGVDVFFIISGFLITSHILRDIRNGSFKLSNFYLNRIRRILPALLTVLFFTTLTAYFLLILPDLQNYSSSLLMSLTSLSNIYFGKFINVGYFSTNATVLPLLHTWSLGVEEQFYIIWPLCLVLLFKFLTRNRILLITYTLTSTSFIIYYLSKSNTLFAHYSPIARAFELLFGALLAFHFKSLKLSKTKILNHFLSLIGIGLIVYSGLILGQNDYPGICILAPCLGTLILLLSGKESYPIGNKIISNPILVSIGLISYSLYLWHWPLIAFLNYFKIIISNKIALAVIIISLILSFSTWKYIEKPFRHEITFSFKKTIIRFFIYPILFSIIFYTLLRIDGFYIYNQITAKQISNSKMYYGIIKEKDNCEDNIDGSRILPSEDKCVIGYLEEKKSSSVLIVGDSHAMAAVGMLNTFLINKKLKGYVVTQSGTPFILGNIPNWRENKPMERNNLIANLIKHRNYNYIIFAGFWDYYAFPNFNSGFKSAIELALKNKIRPIILLDNPPLFNISKLCGLTRINVQVCSNSIKAVKDIQARTRNMILKLKEDFPQIIFIDPNKIICDEDKCYSSINSLPLYMSDGDNSHLSFVGSSLVGELYMEKYGNPFDEKYQFIPEFY